MAEDKRWCEVTVKEVALMGREVSSCRFPVTGRGLYRDEFVTCGGVSLKEVLYIYLLLYLQNKDYICLTEAHHAVCRWS